MICLTRGLVISLLLSSTWAQSGQVLVVDDTPGPGVDFANLRVATESASDGDILLLREGSYSFIDASYGPLVINKGLVLVAEEDARVRGELQVRLDPGQLLAMRGLNIRSDPPPPGYFKGFRLATPGSRGITWVEDVKGSLDSADFRIYSPFGKEDSGLTLQRCMTSAVLASGTSFSAHDSVFRELGFSIFDQSLALSGSDVLISRGIFLPDANLLNCSALLIEHQGPVTASGPPTISPQQARSYMSSALAREGGSVQASFLGEPGDRILLVVGTHPSSLFRPQFEGTLLVAPPFLVPPFFCGTIPASGALTLNFPMSARIGNTEGLPYFTQAIFVDSTNRLFMGPGSLVVVVDSSF